MEYQSQYRQNMVILDGMVIRECGKVREKRRTEASPRAIFP
jgi:hypothetical protein